MCDFSKGLILCKCANETIRFRDKDNLRYVNGEVKVIPNKKNENIPLIFIWQLFRHAGKVETSEIGRYLVPGDDLGNSLNAEWIELNLNLTNCFDFEYIPNEGDNLVISRNVKWGTYISFIFRDKAWNIDHYSPFEDDRQNFLHGKLKAPE
jgi:hypothetical protein